MSNAESDDLDAGTGEERPWLRRKGEPNLWYERFRRYCRMGARRSLLRLANEERVKQGKARSNNLGQAWTNAARKWDWQERAEAWDEAARRREDEVVEKRRRQLLEEEWTTRATMLEKVRQMLLFPVGQVERRETSADGKMTVVSITNPARWSMADVARLVETADRMGRLSTGLSTEKVISELTGKDGAPLPANSVVIYLPDNGRDGDDGDAEQEQDNGDGDPTAEGATGGVSAVGG